MSNKKTELVEIAPYFNISLNKLTERFDASKGYINKIKQHFIDASSELLQDTGKLKKVKVPVMKNKRSIVIGLGDIHYGKEAHNMSDGSISFNSQIVTARMHEIIDNVLSEYINVPGSQYNEIVLLLLGDIVEGDGTIYPTQIFDLEANILEQVTIATRDLYDVVKKCSEAMAAKKGIVSIYAIPGNHGERRGGYLVDPKSNWDTVVYQNLLTTIATVQSVTNKMKNINFEYDGKEYNDFSVKGWKFHMRHKAPMLLSNDKSQSMIRNWCENHNDADYFITAHWHNEYIANVGKIKVIRNGSFCGADNYTDTLGILADDPQQFVLGVSENCKTLFYQSYIFKERNAGTRTARHAV